MTDFDWRKARNPLVQELGWCLFSESIVDQLPPATSIPWPCREDRGAREILATLDSHPAPLQQHLDTLTDKRLGARFEAMWTFYLSHHPQFELLAHNWPVEKAGKTLGALDLLFRDKDLGAVIHGEIAVKFYLYYPDHPGSTLQKWIGPNPDDSLADKVEHLAHHQLPLSSAPETLLALQSAGLPQPQSRSCVIKGFLFHPRGQTIALPPPFNPHHLRGEWLHVHELPALFADKTLRRWNLIHKQQWLLPTTHSLHSSSEVTRKIALLLEKHPQPVMLWSDNSVDSANESARYLVLPPHWPLKARH